MDASSSNNRTRKFPSYTLAQLEAWVAEGRGSDLIVAEIEARKSGASKVLVTPQIMGGKIVLPSRLFG